MFTLKFYSPCSGDSESSEVWRVVSANEYELYDRSNGSFEVVANGTSYNISREDKHYQACYIENQSGKTIATYGQRI